MPGDNTKLKIFIAQSNRTIFLLQNLFKSQHNKTITEEISQSITDLKRTMSNIMECTTEEFASIRSVCFKINDILLYNGHPSEFSSLQSYKRKMTHTPIYRENITFHTTIEDQNVAASTHLFYDKMHSTGESPKKKRRVTYGAVVRDTRAHVYISRGQGVISVNDIPIEQFFPNKEFRDIATKYLEGDMPNKFQIKAFVASGKKIKQALAVQHVIKKVVLKYKRLLSCSKRHEMRRSYGLLTKENKLKEIA